EGLLRLTRTESKGKMVHEVCAITEKGIGYLLSQVSPKQVLEDLVRTLEARQTQVGELVAAAQRTQASFEELKTSAEKVLCQVEQPTPLERPAGHDWVGAVLDHLTAWQNARAFEDCPLPDLYQKARELTPALTIGRFHDGIRLLHDQKEIY